MSANMQELQWQVVVNCHCIWEMFLENVRNEGWTMSDLTKAADECGDDPRAMRRLINAFI